MDKGVFYVFVLLFLLVAVAYYVGFVADSGAIASALQQLFYAVTGRDSTGKFAGYPAAA